MSDTPPDAPKTPDDWLRLAESFERRASELREQLALAEQMARLARVSAELGKTGGLTNMYPEGTVPGTQMQAPSPSHGANISAAKSKGRTAFQAALIKRNLSVPEWARAQRKPRVEVESAKSWVKRSSKGARKIPRFWADRIADEFKDEKGRSEVPATLASWPNGIMED